MLERLLRSWTVLALILFGCAEDCDCDYAHGGLSGRTLRFDDGAAFGIAGQVEVQFGDFSVNRGAFSIEAASGRASGVATVVVNPNLFPGSVVTFSCESATIPAYACTSSEPTTVVIHIVGRDVTATSDYGESMGSVLDTPDAGA